MLHRETFLVSLFVYIYGQEIGVILAGKVSKIDYSSLADKAERHKNEILKFLNQTNVREQYKAMYDCLLKTLMSNSSHVIRSANSVTTEIKDGSETNNNLNTSRRGESNGTSYNTRLGSARRIVSGQNTSIEAMPWQVSLREKTYPICGGSVITDVWLLTAAHCLLRTRSSDLSVRLGSSWKTYGGEMYDVKECYVHPRYTSKTKVNDAGLVRLYSALRFSAKVMPIRLVAREARLRANEVAIISGWGKLKESGPSATYLQSAMIKTIAMKQCRRSGLDRVAIDPVSMFCAGSFQQPSPDACQGDSGGPLVSDGVLIGVVSWGLGCARGNFPGVFTRLSHPIIWDWIQGHISKN